LKKFVQNFDFFRILDPSNGFYLDYSNQDTWNVIKRGAYVKISHYPNGVEYFAQHLTELKDIFEIRADFVLEAQRRYQK
jgi:hypothetical protein